ncbi:MAG: hypothetical protein EBY16_01710 [Gammaproteobacteria bacterium]|nr:hypothetical protein [Gammaproteobacteria bacterium]
MLTLDELDHFDFTQMRALEGTATDDALEVFHRILNDFFNQFDTRLITPAALDHYLEHMQVITSIINEAEYQYFLAKYQTEYVNETLAMRESMANATRLNSYKKIPVRLESWSHDPNHKPSIRNPEQHVRIVEKFTLWNRMIDREQPTATQALSG